MALLIVSVATLVVLAFIIPGPLQISGGNAATLVGTFTLAISVVLAAYYFSGSKRPKRESTEKREPTDSIN
jgi:hypothetical protein